MSKKHTQVGCVCARRIKNIEETKSKDRWQNSAYDPKYLMRNYTTRRCILADFFLFKACIWTVDIPYKWCKCFAMAIKLTQW